MSSPYPNSPRGKAQGEGCDSDREGAGEPHTNPPWTCEHMLSAQGLPDPMTPAPQHVFYESRPPHIVESRNLARGLAAVQRRLVKVVFWGEEAAPGCEGRTPDSWLPFPIWNAGQPSSHLLI